MQAAQKLSARPTYPPMSYSLALSCCTLFMQHPQGQASSKGLECELLRKKLAAAEGNITSLRTDLQDSQQEVVQLRQQAQALESEAGEAQAVAEGQVGWSGWCLNALGCTQSSVCLGLTRDCCS